MLLFNFFNWNPTVIDCIIADGIIKSQVRINENVSWMAIQSSGCKVLRSSRTIERTPSNLSEFRPYVLVLTWGNITNKTRMYEAVLTDLLMMVWREELSIALDMGSECDEFSRRNEMMTAHSPSLHQTETIVMNLVKWFQQE